MRYFRSSRQPSFSEGGRQAEGWVKRWEVTKLHPLKQGSCPFEPPSVDRPPRGRGLTGVVGNKVFPDSRQPSRLTNDDVRFSIGEGGRQACSVQLSACRREKKPSGSPLAAMAYGLGKGAIARKGMSPAIAEERFSRDDGRRKEA
jgi:hypothetical protein